MANILGALQAQQQRASQQAESLSERLERMDAFQGAVDPQIRAQALDFSGRPTLANPLDSIAGQLDLGERSRNQRASIADDLARAEATNLDALSKIDTISRRGGSGKTPAQAAREELTQLATMADAFGLDKQAILATRPDLTAQAFGLEQLLTQPQEMIGPLREGEERPVEQVADFSALQNLLGSQKIPKLEGKEKRDFESTLRTELEDSAIKNNFFEIKNANRTVQSAKENAAGDLSLIFSYMKILDPGSTVREGEFANAQNAAGVPQQIINTYNRVKRGERLAPEQRAQFKDQAQSIYNVTAERQKELNDYYSTIAQEAGVDPKNVLGVVGDIEISETGSVDRLDTSDPRIQQAIQAGFSEEQIRSFLNEQ